MSFIRKSTERKSMDIPCLSPRPGGYIKIQEFKPCAISTPNPSFEDYNATCACSSPVCKSKVGASSLALNFSEDDVSKMKSFSCNESAITRDYRINQAMKKMELGEKKCCIEKNSKSDDEEEEAMAADNATPINPMGIVISAIMLLAKQQPVPDNILDSVVNTLNNFYSGLEIRPPNVQGLLNHIALLRGGSIPAAEEAPAEE